MIAVNVTGVFVATQEAARHMKTGGRVDSHRLFDGAIRSLSDGLGLHAD